MLRGGAAPCARGSTPLALRLQKPELSFVYIRWCKRADRALQLALLAAAATAAARLAGAALGLAARALARTALGAALPANGAVAALPAAVVAAAAALFARRRMGTDVADVLAEQVQSTETDEAGKGQSGTRPAY